MRLSPACGATYTLKAKSRECHWPRVFQQVRRGNGAFIFVMGKNDREGSTILPRLCKPFWEGSCQGLLGSKLQGNSGSSNKESYQSTAMAKSISPWFINTMWFLKWFTAGLTPGERQSVSAWAADRELKGEVVGLDTMAQLLRIKEQRNATASALAGKGDLVDKGNPDVEPMDVEAVAARAATRRRDNRDEAPPRGITPGGRENLPFISQIRAKAAPLASAEGPRTVKWTGETRSVLQDPGKLDGIVRSLGVGSRQSERTRVALGTLGRSGQVGRCWAVDGPGRPRGIPMPG